MDAETLLAFRRQKLRRQELGRERRELTMAEFGPARKLAIKSGLILRRHSEHRYTLMKRHSWLLNLFPGPQRIQSDKNRPKQLWIEYEKVEGRWSLLSIVLAAIEAEGK